MEGGGIQGDRVPREDGEVIPGAPLCTWGPNVSYHREENGADEKGKIKSEVTLPRSQMLQEMLGFCHLARVNSVPLSFGRKG